MVRRKRDVHHEDGPEVDLRHVELVTALRTIAEREDETGDQCRQVQPFEADTQHQTSSTQQFRITQTRRKNPEDEEEVTDREPGEDHLDCVVQKFQREHELQNRGVM